MKFIHSPFIQSIPRGAEDIQGGAANGPDAVKDEADRLWLLAARGRRPQPRELCLRRHHSHEERSDRLPPPSRTQRASTRKLCLNSDSLYKSPRLQ